MQTRQPHLVNEAAADEPEMVFRYSCYSDLQVKYEGISQNIVVRAPDISTRGMFITTPQAFPLGAKLMVRFRLGHSGTPIQTRAEVRYCLEGVGICVEFTNMPDESRAAIEAACAHEAEW